MAKKERENAPVSGSDEPETGKPTVTVNDAPVLAARLSVQLDDHGNIAWDRMRPETQAKLRAALGTPGPGTGTTAAPAAQGGGFPPELCGVLYDSLSVLFVGLARRSGYTEAQAARMSFTPDERGQLVPPTVAVLNKYNTSLGKYQEEIVLGVLVTTILSGKLAALRADAPAAPILVRQGEQGMMSREQESQEEKAGKM